MTRPSQQGTTKKNLTYIQRKEIDQALQPILKSNDDGTCTYDKGWSDAAVALTMPFQCNSDHVATVRKQVFGMLYKNPTGVHKNTIRELLAVKDEEIADLVHAVNALSARVVKLEMALTWNEGDRKYNVTNL
tara:strand:- start:18288 stop:18683 length:396 start_codon:yes stop_codon:yes gene_type:complete